ncbi:tetratricopeptide repeat protein [Patescibacteria group bacterium]
MNSLKKILKKNIKIILLLTFLSFLVYFNSLKGDFAVVDDLFGFVKNEQIRNLPSTLKTLNLQNIVFSISLHFFKINPLPLHIFSLLLHIVIVVLSFLTIFQLFNKKVAIFASLLFTTHPINTEAIAWISGSIYLYNALFAFLTILSYLIFKKSQKLGFLLLSLLIYSLGIVLVRSPWVLATPLALLIIDQFLLEKSWSLSSLKKLGLFLIPMLIFYFSYVYKQQVERINPRQSIGYMNQQSLKPVIESYPYTVYSLAKQYAFPKTLTIYYDGNKLSKTDYTLMYLVFTLYIAALLYCFKKDKKIAGTLLLLLILLAPTFSPKKIIWFFADRYLYLGSAFYCALIAYILLKIEKKTKIKNLTLISIVVITFLFSVRTIIRNNDWKNPKSLALATISTSPLSVRPYNDLAGAYYLEGNWKKAIEYYEKALLVFPNSNTAISNLGLIYLEKGLPDSLFAFNDLEEKSNPVSAEANFQAGNEYFNKEDYRMALYYLVSAATTNPQHEKTWQLLGTIYMKNKDISEAEKVFINLSSINPQSEIAFYNLGYIEFTKKNYTQALSYLEKTLEINPLHQGALDNLEVVKNILN